MWDKQYGPCFLAFSQKHGLCPFYGVQGVQGVQGEREVCVWEVCVRGVCVREVCVYEVCVCTRGVCVVLPDGILMGLQMCFLVCCFPGCGNVSLVFSEDFSGVFSGQGVCV